MFRQWAREHFWEALHDALRVCLRRAEGRHPQPSAAILDSRSVKSDGHGGEVGYDAGKRIKGRKRHLLVDTLGTLLGVRVTPASCPEREGGQAVLKRVGEWFPRLHRIWADGGYTGEDFRTWGKERWDRLELEVVRRSDEVRGLVVLPRRLVVERTFSWLMRHRRLVRALGP